jgi:azurin
MESTSETGKLQITEHTKRLLDEAQGDGHSFSIAIAERMEAVQVKGIGRMKTWYVTRCPDAIIANTHVSATVISASTHTLARRSSLGAAALGLDIHRQSSSRGMGSIA